MKRFRNEKNELTMVIKEITRITEQEAQEYYKNGIFLYAKDGREYVRLREDDDEILTHFQSFDGYNLFIPTDMLGTFLPDVASDDLALSSVE